MDYEKKHEATEHLHQITAFWNWLPAFRVVAETEHLPSASEILRVSASALSRMIKLLEEHIERELFVRTSRGIRLTPEGQILLRSVRNSMRTVHDGLTEVCGQHTQGKVQVASSGLATRAYVVPALLTLREKHPGLVPVLQSLSNEDARDALLKGALDVLFTEKPIVHADLTIERLSQESHGIYCGPGHPLNGVSDVSLEEVVSHPFCGPVVDGANTSPDGWPPEVKREVVLFAKEMQVGIGSCLSGSLLAVLPNVVAKAHESLWRIPLDIIPQTSFYAMRRSLVGDQNATSVLLIRAVQEEISR